jgi:Fur family transcriptional regulator, zinc uptake regulator
MAAKKQNSKKAVSAAVSTAAALCEERGARFTDLRRQVYELIVAHGKAVKAYDLIEQLSDDERTAKPITVYRALDFLMEQGLVRRVESLNAFVATAYPEEKDDYVMLVGEDGVTVTEVQGGRVVKSLVALAKDAGFDVTKICVELHVASGKKRGR